MQVEEESPKQYVDIARAPDEGNKQGQCKLSNKLRLFTGSEY